MRIVIAEQEMVKKYHLGVATVLDCLEHPEALVTDESTVADFVDDGFQGDYECAPDYRLQNSQIYALRKLAYGKPVMLDTKIWVVGKWIEGA